MADDKAPAAPAGDAGEPKGTDQGKPITAAWRESFDDPDIKASQSLDKFKGANDKELLGHVAKAYVNLEKMPRGVTPPKEGAPKEEWDKFYSALGRPEKPEDYKIELKVPEGMPWSKIGESLMFKKAHERGLTRSQAEGLMNDYLAMSAEGLQIMKRAQARDTEVAFDEIQKEWGGMTDRNLALVNRCVHEFGGEEFKAYLDETNLGNDPRFLKFCLKMGAPMVETNLIKGEGLGMKSAEAKAEIDRLMASKEWAAGDKATIKRINDLYPIAHSG